MEPETNIDILSTSNDHEKMVIFDVCGTLFRSNTTADFLTFYFKRNSTHKLQNINSITNKKSPIYWFRAFIFRFVGKDLFRKASIRLLKGEDPTLVASEAQHFLTEFLLSKEISETSSMLKKSRDNNEEVMLVSNGLDPVIKVIGDHFKIPFKATTLEVKRGKYTGRISNDLFGTKHELLQNRNISNKVITVVTDNRSDYELVKLADEKVVVLNKTSDKKFWSSLNPVFIEK